MVPHSHQRPPCRAIFSCNGIFWPISTMLILTLTLAQTTILFWIVDDVFDSKIISLELDEGCIKAPRKGQPQLPCKKQYRQEFKVVQPSKKGLRGTGGPINLSGSKIVMLVTIFSVSYKWYPARLCCSGEE